MLNNNNKLTAIAKKLNISIVLLKHFINNTKKFK